MRKEWQQFISDKLSIDRAKFVSVGGGSINQAYRIESSKEKFFCKVNSAKNFPQLFGKEKNGLAFLRNTKTLSVPELIWCGEHDGQQILILEWIEQGLRTNSFWKKFGKGMAALHSSDRPGLTAFGYVEDNYMGALPQVNTPMDNWVDFFIHCRLKPQLELAANEGLVTNREQQAFEKLYERLNDIFPVEKPAALHGDLWSGNYLCSRESAPVLIDPAVYYGHRSIDLGMTKLFGGFDEEFYQAYHYHFPLPKNFEEQADVCNLYPLLIHLNLFGSGYLSSIRSILRNYQ